MTEFVINTKSAQNLIIKKVQCVIIPQDAICNKHGKRKEYHK